MHDVLAELRDELDALVLEALGGLRAVGVHGAQHAVAEALELLVLRHEVGLAADARMEPTWPSRM